jgi:hypothetical protein
MLCLADLRFEALAMFLLMPRCMTARSRICPAPRFGDRKPVQSARQEANFSRITGRVIISARLWTSL